MPQETLSQWPEFLGQNDDMYYVENLDSGEIEYLILSSYEKRGTFSRESGAWWRVSPDFSDKIDDPKYSIEFVDVDFIPRYDQIERDMPRNKTLMVPPKSPVVAAADSQECPKATQDVAVNLKNRRRAISVGNYGPLDPSKQNVDFWAEKAELWSITPDEAKGSLCGNCAFFDITSAMLNCIESGISAGEPAKSTAWDAVEAGDLGYCKAFDFKCAASRTCDAWVTGGPISDNSGSEGEGDK